MQDLLALAYPYVKAVHLMAVISWMAGIFYLPRLFVYHAERTAPGEPTSEIFKVMEAKLMTVIMRPAMIVTWICGLLLAATPGVLDWSEGWVWLKLSMVLAMTAFHVALRRWMDVFASDGNTRSGRYYRMMNEVPTLLMIAIVLLVIVRPF